MNTGTLIATGLAGSAALTAINEAFKEKKKTPQLDKLGMQAIRKLIGKDAPKNNLYSWALAGDIAGNSFFYSIVAKAKHPIRTGLVFGTGIGFMALVSPELFGLDEAPVKSGKKKKWKTVGYYALGGLAAGVTAKVLK